MKRILVILAVVVVVVVSCSDDDSITAPEPCTPFFSAESLQVVVEYIYLPLLDVWVWGAKATYKYELYGCSGKIHTHEFVFSEPGETLTVHDNTIADCFEPIDIQLDKTARVSTTDDLFAGFDSVTVFFTLRGLHQQCYSGAVDSIAPIIWSNTVRAEVLD